MTTYNHEKYIAEAINSVLEQTFKDFELIIVNDGSTDKTDEIIKTFLDNLDNERIVYINQENQGISTATNNGILAAKGKYIAWFSGDDVFYPQKLEKQWNFISQHNSKIIFSLFDVIDDNSNITFDPVIDAWFIKENISREELINIFFIKGNCLNAVTAFVEKECLLDAGLFNPASIQLQDFDMWIKLIKRHEILIIMEKLVKYRVRDNNQNLSNSVNDVRTYFEMYQIYKKIFDDMPIEVFKRTFSKWLKKTNFTSSVEYELEKAFMYLNHHLLLIQTIGSEKLFNLLQDANILAIAKKEYNFSLPELYALNKKMDISNTSLLQEAQLEQERLRSWIQELTTGKNWLESQYITWKQTAEAVQAQLAKSHSWIQELIAGKDWLESQYYVWKKQAADTQIELEQSRSQLQSTQVELEQSRSQLQNTQVELEYSKSKLQQAQTEIERLQLAITMMLSSKFWKLRNLWFKLKQKIGLKVF